MPNGVQNLLVTKDTVVDRYQEYDTFVDGIEEPEVEEDAQQCDNSVLSNVQTARDEIRFHQATPILMSLLAILRSKVRIYRISLHCH
jgi:hypothetical protein